MRHPFKKILSQIPIEQAHGGTGSRQVILSQADPISANIEAMTKWYLKAWCIFDWHFHDNIDEFFLVTKGHGRIEFRDNTLSQDYQEGDLIYIPCNLEHTIIAWNVENEFFFIRVKSA